MHSCSHHPQSERDPSSLSPSRHVTKSGPRLRWQSDRAALTAHLVVGDRDRGSPIIVIVIVIMTISSIGETRE